MPQLLPGVSSGVSKILGEEPESWRTKDVHRSIEKNDGIPAWNWQFQAIRLAIKLQANLQLTNRFVGRLYSLHAMAAEIVCSVLHAKLGLA